MADYVETYVDKQVKQLARKIRAVYAQAEHEIKSKMDTFLADHAVKAAKMLSDMQSGKITKAAYQSWLKGQVFQGEMWKKRLADITNVYVNADIKAREIIRGTSKNVFCEAANYTAYSMESDLRILGAFAFYDQKTVERLIRDNPKMLPEWKINEKKDYIWNEGRVQNALTQGIVQGESVYDIAKRLFTDLSASNGDKMVLFARTAMTGAQNAGRIDRLHEAEDMGIEVKKKWLATLDDRTRDTHQELDGQTVPVDEPFVVDGQEIDYPGDPSAPPELVYNCRCTLTYVYPKYEKMAHRERLAYDTDEEGKRHSYTVGDMTYKEWKANRGRSN